MFVLALQHLAAVHNSYGILPAWYNVMGLTLLYAVRRVLGPDRFTPELEVVWKKTYSRMMLVIIPVAVSGQTLAQVSAAGGLANAMGMLQIDLKTSEYKNVADAPIDSSNKKPSERRQQQQEDSVSRTHKIAASVGGGVGSGGAAPPVPGAAGNRGSPRDMNRTLSSGATGSGSLGTTSSAVGGSAGSGGGVALTTTRSSLVVSVPVHQHSPNGNGTGNGVNGSSARGSGGGAGLPLAVPLPGSVPLPASGETNTVPTTINTSPGTTALTLLSNGVPAPISGGVPEGGLSITTAAGAAAAAGAH